MELQDGSIVVLGEAKQISVRARAIYIMPNYQCPRARQISVGSEAVMAILPAGNELFLI